MARTIIRSLSAVKEQLNELPVDPSLQWQSLESRFITIANRLCPVRYYEIRKERPQYFTNEISSLIQERDQLFKRARTSSNQNNKTRLWQKAIKEGNEVRTRLKSAKKITLYRT